MLFLKEVMGRVFAVWAALIFVVTMLPVGLLMWLIGFINEPKRTMIFRQISKVWMSIFFVLIGCRLKVKGINNFEKGKNYIIICNHNSMMDVPVTTPFIPGANKTIAKIEMSRIPLFGLIYKRGSILVDRKDKNSRSDSYKKMREILDMGMHMCIYPEGTRNKTTQPLKEFHDGAFKLAMETKKSILPAVIFNTNKVLPNNKTFFFRPAAMELHFLPPVLIRSDDSYENLKQKLFELMSRHYITHYKGS